MNKKWIAKLDYIILLIYSPCNFFSIKFQPGLGNSSIQVENKDSTHNNNTMLITQMNRVYNKKTVALQKYNFIQLCITSIKTTTRVPCNSRDHLAHKTNNSSCCSRFRQFSNFVESNRNANKCESLLSVRPTSLFGAFRNHLFRNVLFHNYL